jgi:hypothetical protein
MDITIVGAKDKDLAKNLRLAANSFGKNLFSPQLAKHINLNIKIQDKLDAGGYCYCISDKSPPRTFIIEIFRARKKIHMFSALAHEMVHVKQMAKGEIKDKKLKHNYVTIWRGKTYANDLLYWDHPWEIEAYGLQESLVAKFLIEHDQFKNLRQKRANWFVYD